MKVKKQLIEGILLEDDNETADSTDSVADIADAIEAQTDGAVSEKEAKAMAAEAKAVGSAVEGEVIADTPAIADIKDVDDDLNIENTLTKFLQKNYEKALRNKRMGRGTNSDNVIIVGLPGSGKTASFMDWARHASPQVHVTYLNAKNNDLEAFINGYTVRVPGAKTSDVGSVRQAFGNNLDSLDRPNSILFLDEFNRQTKDQIRASLLTLINEHYVMGTGEVKGITGVHHFPNLLFTVACCNPAREADKGAGRLNSAEITRFGKVIAYDSSPAETELYLKKHYEKQMNSLNSKAPYYKEDLLALLKTLDLGLFIVSKADFRYDDIKDVDAVADLYLNDKSGREGGLWNQRLLTYGLEDCMGDVEDFKNWYHNEIVILPKNIKMLDEILSYYEVPSDYDLAAKYFPEAKDLFEKPAAAANNNDAVNDNDEDDPDLFVGANAEDSDADINSVISSWEDSF